tara:strand:+ start:2075 stop:2365 length:291 start_codon:yes stop_codon:yes gene_type:complete
MGDFSNRGIRIMKNILISTLLMFVVGCGTIKKQAYKTEVKYATEWKESKLEEKLKDLIEKGDLTSKQAEKIREGAYWLLEKIIERAENKLKAQEGE